MAGRPGRIPAQLIAHILYYFSKQNDLVFDPMAGGGVTPDTCLALNRRCWAFDMIERPETRPEIESHTWVSAKRFTPLNSKTIQLGDDAIGLEEWFPAPWGPQRARIVPDTAGCLEDWRCNAWLYFSVHFC